MQDVVMSKPGCDAGCSRCSVACASLPARLEFWADRSAKLLRQVSLGVDDAQLRDQLGIAEVAHKGLMQQYAATPQAALRQAFRA